MKGKDKCVWGSMPPGTTYLPLASMTVVSDGACRSGMCVSTKFQPSVCTGLPDPLSHSHANCVSTVADPLRTAPRLPYALFRSAWNTSLTCSTTSQAATWQQFYVEYVTATVASAQSRTTYWAVVTGRFIGDRQNIGDIGGTAAAARAAPLFTAVGLVSAMATAIASAPASPDQQSLIATPMAVPPPIGSTPVPESQPQPPALFFLFCFLLGYRGIVHPPSADEGTKRTWFEPAASCSATSQAQLHQQCRL